MIPQYHSIGIQHGNNLKNHLIPQLYSRRTRQIPQQSKHYKTSITFPWVDPPGNDNTEFFGLVWAGVGDCEDGDLDAGKGEAQAAPVDYVSFLFVGLEVLDVFE
jgi:hypothetical protein